MKSTTCKFTMVLGLAFTLSAVTGLDPEAANAASPAQRGDGARGGRGGGNGGGNADGRRGGNGGASGDGGVQVGGGFRGGGGLHAPSIVGPRNAGGGVHFNNGSVPGNNGGGGGNDLSAAGNIGAGAGRNNGVRDNVESTIRNNAGGIRIGGNQSGNGQTTLPNRPPSLSHPNPGSIRSQITQNPILNNRGNINVNPNSNANVSPNATRRDAVGDNRFNPRNQGPDDRNSNRFGGTPNSNLNRVSGIINRQYPGNSLTFNNRQIPLANNQYRPAYYRHPNHYHGYWNISLGQTSGTSLGYGWGLGNSYGYGRNGNGGYGYGGRNSRYGYRPLGWGLGGWGLGSLAYQGGYLRYSNPYYTSGGWNGYNYSQPIYVSYITPVTIVDNSGFASTSALDEAIAAFRQNNYAAALDIVNRGITQTPDDAVLHEFRALVLFAQQDYQQAAATIHSVLAVGPGWDWTTLSGMYTNVDLYTTQLRALEAFTKSYPQDATGHFLLAYHYLTCGHSDAAISQLEQVVALNPADRVAADILKMLRPLSADDATSSADAPRAITEFDLPPVQSINPKMLVGNWKASRPDGSTFTLNMTDDLRFTWSFALRDQPTQEFGGTYTVEENVLALQRKDGGSLIAEVTTDANGQFNFRMLGAPEEDPGLDFSKLN